MYTGQLQRLAIDRRVWVAQFCEEDCSSASKLPLDWLTSAAPHARS